MDYSLQATTLVYPMFAMVLLTFAVMGVLAHARYLGIKSGNVDLKHFKTLQAGEPTEYMTKASRHLINLFEVPVLFYAGCATAIGLHMDHQWLQIWAWVFVAARVAQAIIHIGPNKVKPRFLSYVTGTTAVFAFWITLISHL